MHRSQIIRRSKIGICITRIGPLCFCEYLQASGKYIAVFSPIRSVVERISLDDQKRGRVLDSCQILIDEGDGVFLAASKQDLRPRVDDVCMVGQHL